WVRKIRPLFTVYLPVLPYVLFALFPLYFMLVTSLKSNAELYDVNAVPFWISRGLTADHYALLSADTPFWSWFANSLIVSLASTALWVFLGVLPAYPLARLRFAGSDSFGIAIFVTYLVPPSLLFPAAHRSGELARSLGHPVGADHRLPDLPRTVLHLAPHGIL